MMFSRLRDSWHLDIIKLSKIVKKILITMRRNIFKVSRFRKSFQTNRWPTMVGDEGRYFIPSFCHIYISSCVRNYESINQDNLELVVSDGAVQFRAVRSDLWLLLWRDEGWTHIKILRYCSSFCYKWCSMILSKKLSIRDQLGSMMLSRSLHIMLYLWIIRKRRAEVL